jgi:hypothetical protein
MKTCEFNIETCPANCINFQICQYTFLQKQLSEIQTQISFIYKTLAEVMKRIEGIDP